MFKFILSINFNSICLTNIEKNEIAKVMVFKKIQALPNTLIHFIL